MGSGEADAIKVPVANTFNSVTTTDTLGSTLYVEPYTTFGTTWTYGTTVYMYQLTCPRCKNMNWGQLDHIIACSKCKAKLKAVSQTVDYEIPITT